MGFKKRAQVLLAASVFAVCAATHFSTAIKKCSNGEHPVIILLLGIAAVTSLLATVLCLDIWQLNPADSHTLSTLYSQYRALLLLRLKAPYIRWLLNKKTMDAKKTSEETLLRILKMNKKTVYGKQWHFADIKSREEFVRVHPLTTQEHYKHYVDRMLNGEQNILHSGKTKAFVGTSGTTGTSKTYPFSEQHINDAKFMLGSLCSLGYSSMMNLQRYAQFHIYSPMRTTAGGIPMAAGTQVAFFFPPHNLIPSEYSRLHLEDDSYYAQAVFSLAERELRYISGFSADLMFAYWKFITTNWERLCEDIANGYIGEHNKMPEDVKQDLSGHLQADPARAADLREAIKLGTRGLAKRIWPDMKFILMGKSAGFKFCCNALMEEHFQGLEIIDYAHGATEGMLGINTRTSLDDDENAFTLLLFPSFYSEFIPLKDVEVEQPKTVFPEQVNVGDMYEIVHTNGAGLYRTRFGDIVKIVGFHNGTPNYRFMYKLGQRLNIAYERTPDAFLIRAIGRETRDLPDGVKLVDFTSTESIILEKITGKDSKGHYVFFVEFDSNKTMNCKSIANKVDLTLAELYEQYKRFKDTDSIGPVELIQVRCGTFDGVKSYIWGDTPHGQFKMPRVLRREPALKYLLGQTVDK